MGAGTGAITVGWDRNPETNIAGYKIYWGELRGQYTNVVDVGNNIVGSVSGLASGRTYYCSVKAYNTSLQESPFSAEIPLTYTSQEPTEPDPSSRLVLLEAENGQLNAPATIMGTGTDVYVDTNNYATATNGYTRMSFDIATAGDYQVWCRVKASAASMDSFFVTMDNGTEDIFHVYVIPDTTEPRAADWIWKRIHIPAGAPRSYTLTAGAHTFKVRTREQGTCLDRVVLSNDPNFVPSDALPRTTDAVIVTSNPASLTRTEGESAVLEVAAAATGPVSYQWKRNNVAITGATSAQLLISSVAEAHEGNYTVDLYRGTASASGGPAVLTVNPAAGAAPTLKVAQMTMNLDRSLSFQLSGGLLSSVQIYASNDLSNWTLISTQVNTSGSITIIDPAAVTGNKRFYKLVTE